MQTRFTPEQLARPAVARADRILRTCEHYGFCTAGCPTYVLLGDENDAPRGRIDLIREMLEAGGAPDAKTVGHLDRCLSCMSCMTTCAVRVDYLHLIDIARAHIARHHRRPWHERFVRGMLAFALPRPAVFRALLALAPFSGGIVATAPRPLARRLRPLLAMAAATPRTREPDVRPGDHRPAGVPRGRVILLAGCAQRVLAPSINAATVRVLNRAGYTVTIAPSAGCCGSLTLHLGNDGPARDAARRNIDAWIAELARAPQAGEVVAIVANASGCGSTMKDYGHLLADDPRYRGSAERIAALARDVSELLAEVRLAEPATPRRYAVACHDPCSLRNVQRVTDAPRALLARAGYVVREIPEAHFCCGSAGTYNLLQPRIAEQLGRRKAAHVAGTGAQIVAAGNVGCVVQIARYADRPVVHPIELVDWAHGGPRPPALVGVALDELPPELPPNVIPIHAVPTNAAGAPPPADPSAPGIW